MSKDNWRYWADRAYDGWLKAEEQASGQLNVFDPPPPEPEPPRYSQISRLPGVTFEEIFQR